MSVVYVDTSALGRVLMRESQRLPILASLAGFEQITASRLMRTEFRRLGMREDRVHEADMLLDGISLLPIDEALLQTVETLPPWNVGTLDAIHLATALRLANTVRLDAIMTYDQRLAQGARQHGLPVLSPT